MSHSSDGFRTYNNLSLVNPGKILPTVSCINGQWSLRLTDTGIHPTAVTTKLILPPSTLKKPRVVFDPNRIYQE